MNFEDDQPPNQAKSLMYFALSVLIICAIVVIALALLSPYTGGIFTNVIGNI